MLGFAGLSIGYFLPVGSWIGKTIEALSPTRDYEPSARMSFRGSCSMASDFRTSCLAFSWSARFPTGRGAQLI